MESKDEAYDIMLRLCDIKRERSTHLGEDAKYAKRLADITDELLDEFTEFHEKGRDSDKDKTHENVYQIDIWSVRRAINGCEEPFLSDGYQWTDKPHRIMRYAMEEIEFLREREEPT